MYGVGVFDGLIDGLNRRRCMSLKHIRRPELFQGKLDKKHYFEGWYFKHVDGSGKHTVAFIPGISLDEADSHSFVQVIVSPDIKTYYFRYPLASFRTTESPFSVAISDSVFSMDGCKVDLHDTSLGISITGETRFSGLTPIETTTLMPNIMGFFAYIPGMECNHGVLSMNHSVNGWIRFGDAECIDFAGGKGYIEKDWGKSFPSEYIWIHSNHFEGAGDSFMCSIAHIPFGLFSFRGLIANLHLGGKEYRFATYNRSRVNDFVIEEKRISFKLEKDDLVLSCEAQLVEDGALKAPEKGEMLRTIKEGLGGRVSLKLMEKGKVLAVLESECAGIEIVTNGRLANPKK